MPNLSASGERLLADYDLFASYRDVRYINFTSLPVSFSAEDTLKTRSLWPDQNNLEGGANVM